MDHRSPKKNFRHCLPMTFTMDDNEWVNSEKEACSASFSYWAGIGKSTGWNWPLGWKRSNEENRHLPTSFLGLFYPTLKKKLKSETMILGGGPCSQSVRLAHICITYHILRRYGNLFFCLPGPCSARGSVSASGLPSSCPEAETGIKGFFLAVDPFIVIHSKCHW